MSNKQSKDDIKPAKTLDKNAKQHWKQLTRQQRVFVNELLKDDTTNGTQAAKTAYPTATYNAQRAIASENLTKPNILAVLDKHSVDAENTVVEVMNTSDNDNTRLNAANSLLDRVHGKPTQRTESVSLSIEAVVDDLHA